MDTVKLFDELAETLDGEHFPSMRIAVGEFGVIEIKLLFADEEEGTIVAEVVDPGESAQLKSQFDAATDTGEPLFATFSADGKVLFESNVEA